MLSKMRKLLYNVYNNVNNWYIKAVGLDVVREAQNKVCVVKKELIETQERRSFVEKQLTIVRTLSSELDEEKYKIKTHDDFEKIIDLRQQDTQILKLIVDLTNSFNAYDKYERELHTRLCTAINESYEKQNYQIQYTKYLGISLSVAGSIFMYTITYLYRRRNAKSQQKQNSFVTAVTSSSYWAYGGLKSVCYWTYSKTGSGSYWVYVKLKQLVWDGKSKK